MGLSIYYRLKAKVDADGARRLVERMRESIAALPFDGVSDVFEIDPPDGKYVFDRWESGPGEYTAGGYRPGALYLDHKRADGEVEMVEVRSQHVIGFCATVAGSEAATFGLASHPPVVVHRESVITRIEGGGKTHQIGAGAAVEFQTRLRGYYSWWQAVKTQYASDPKLGGESNFLRAHQLIFRAIDECKRIGVHTHIHDDANYWRDRDDAKLLAEVRKWNELIAGFAGRLSDAMPPGAIVAPIKDRSDFEHIEAKGAARLDEMGRGKKRRPGRSR